MTPSADVLRATDVLDHRSPAHEVLPILVRRWSPRAMSGAAIPREKLQPLFEAARWAPSSYNNQPWRFVVATRDDPSWDRFLGLLTQGNREWAVDAAALVVVLSKKSFDHNGKPSRTHSFDTGAAWLGLALQGAASDLVVHAMEGFDWERAREVVGAPDDLAVEAMVAIGEPAPVSELSDDLAEREKPSDRKPLREILFRGEISG